MRTPIVGETPDFDAPDPDHRFLIGKAHVEMLQAAATVGAGLHHFAAILARPSPLRVLADGTIPPPTPDDIGHEETWRAISIMSCDAISAHSSR